MLTQWIQSSDIGKELGCENNSLGGIATDSFGRTNITGVYAAGDASFAPGQLIIAASEGSRAAVGVIMYLTRVIRSKQLHYCYCNSTTAPITI